MQIVPVIVVSIAVVAVGLAIQVGTVIRIKRALFGSYSKNFNRLYTRLTFFRSSSGDRYRRTKKTKKNSRNAAKSLRKWKSTTKTRSMRRIRRSKSCKSN